MNPCTTCGHVQAQHYQESKGCLINRTRDPALWCPCTAFTPEEAKEEHVHIYKLRKSEKLTDNTYDLYVCTVCKHGVINTVPNEPEEEE